MRGKDPIDADTVRRLAGLAGLDLSRQQAAALAPALAELLAVDAAIVALNLGALPAAGLSWGAWRYEPDKRG